MIWHLNRSLSVVYRDFVGGSHQFSQDVLLARAWSEPTCRNKQLLVKPSAHQTLPQVPSGSGRAASKTSQAAIPRTPAAAEATKCARAKHGRDSSGRLATDEKPPSSHQASSPRRHCAHKQQRGARPSANLLVSRQGGIIWCDTFLASLLDIVHWPAQSVLCEVYGYKDVRNKVLQVHGCKMMLLPVSGQAQGHLESMPPCHCLPKTSVVPDNPDPPIKYKFQYVSMLWLANASMLATSGVEASLASGPQHCKRAVSTEPEPLMCASKVSTWTNE